jgi:Ubiquitin fusion degradation protein UFD1
MAASTDALKWSAQYQVAHPDRASRLQGDKITLPQAALEALLAAAPVVSVPKDSSRPYTSTFDPFNPHTFAAEREAREHLGERQQQLPHPLTFRLVNPRNGRVVYAGIREFSADENVIELSRILQDALGLRSGSSAVTREQTPIGDVEMGDGDASEQQVITVHAKQLPKGTYVRLRPLEAGYDPEDWKSLLERHLRDNFTTLTNGEILSIHSGRREKFQFLVDKLEPEGEGICVVDTDLEVDIEALNEEQARETLSRRLVKGQRPPGTAEGSSTGGALVIGEEQVGQVLSGEYVDYEMKTWPKGSRGIDFDLEIDQDDAELDLLFSPFSPRQRAKARDDEHVLADFKSSPSKRIRLSGTNVELEDAEALYVSVHAYQESTESNPSSRPISFVLRATAFTTEAPTTEVDTNNISAKDEVVCKNCHQPIPKRTLALHEAFCYRNNINCPHCNQIFLKNSPTWKSHWHCPHESFHGNTTRSRTKHDKIFHPPTPYSCFNCDFQAPSLPILATHRTSSCPGKEILCQFCHLVVPQQGPEDPALTDPEVLMSGLTPHELVDGARTTECHLCSKIVRLRDMKTHLRIHDRDRLSRPRPTICSNALCGRTVKTTAEGRHVVQQFGLCDECFGPLYVTAHDPEGKALRRRVERRLLQQMMAGCGKAWCHNDRFCRTGRKNLTRGEEDDRGPITAKEALPLVKPVLDALGDGGGPFWFCVDDVSQRRRTLARSMAEEGEYEVEWWVQALEEVRAVGGGDDLEGLGRRAREWLGARAPRIGELVK